MMQYYETVYMLMWWCCCGCILLKNYPDASVQTWIFASTCYVLGLAPRRPSISLTLLSSEKK